MKITDDRRHRKYEGNITQYTRTVEQNTYCHHTDERKATLWLSTAYYTRLVLPEDGVYSVALLYDVINVDGRPTIHPGHRSITQGHKRHRAALVTFVFS